MSSQPHEQFYDIEDAPPEQPAQHDKPSSTMQESETNIQIQNQTSSTPYIFNECLQRDTPLESQPSTVNDTANRDPIFSQQIAQPAYVLDFAANLQEPGNGQQDSQPISQPQSLNIGSDLPGHIVSHLFNDDNDNNIRAYELEQRINREFACYSFLLAVSLVILLYSFKS